MCDRDHPTEIDDSPLTRQTLLSRLKDWGDQESWQEFFDTYWKLIYRTARKAGLPDVEAQEVVQETMISVARAMPEFKYDRALGSFKHWLLQLTGWRINDQIRKRPHEEPLRKPAPDDTARTGTAERVPDPQGLKLEAVWEEEWELNLMDAALTRVKRRVDPRHYQVFDLHVVQNWPVQKVAATLQIGPSQVYVVKHRLSRLLKKEINNLRTSIT